MTVEERNRFKREIMNKVILSSTHQHCDRLGVSAFLFCIHRIMALMLIVPVPYTGNLVTGNCSPTSFFIWYKEASQVESTSLRQTVVSTERFQDDGSGRQRLFRELRTSYCIQYYRSVSKTFSDMDKSEISVKNLILINNLII